MNRKIFVGTLLASTCLAAPARSLIISPPAVRPAVDENGVDVIQGQYVASQTDVSIGPAYPQGLSYTRLGYSAAWNNAVASITAGGGQTIVTYNGSTDAFTGSGSAFVSATGDGAALTQLPNGSYRYTSRDGIVIYFATNIGYQNAYYDASIARATSVTYPDGTVVTYTYKVVNYCAGGYEDGVCQGAITLAQRLQSVTNNHGYQLKFTYAASTIPKGGLPEDNYYAYNNVTAVAAINNAVEYCDPAADSCTLVNSWPTATYSQSGIGQPLTVTDALGRATRYTYSGTTGLVSGIKRPASSTDNITIALNSSSGGTVKRDGMTFTYAISDSGSVRTTTVTDPASNQRVYVSDTSKGVLTSFKDELNRTTTYEYDGYGRQTKVTYPELNYVQTSYDAGSSARGNVTQVTTVAKPGPTISNITTSAVYPSTCANIVVCNKPTSTTDGLSNTTTYTYDPTHGGVLTVTSPAVNGIAPQVRYSYTGLKAYYYTSASSIGPSGTLYELTGTSTCRTMASCSGGSDENKSTISYGLQTGVANNLLPVSSTSGSGDGALAATTSLTYDTIGNALTVQGPLGAAYTTRYRYDADREAIGMVGPDPDGGGALRNRAQRFTYSPDGLVTLAEQGTVLSQSDPDWANFVSLQQVGTTYDSADRKVAQNATASGTAYALVNFSYDTLGRLSCAAQRMNPATFSTPTAACTLAVTGSYGPDRISHNVYDAASEQVNAYSAYGVTVTNGFPVTLQRRDVTYTYSGNSKVLTLTDARNNLTTYTYDRFDRPSQTNYPSPTTHNSSSTTDYEVLTYDANGNVTSRRLRDGNTVGFGYDALNRLAARTSPHITGVTSDPSSTYGYDLLGHLISGSDENSHLLSFGYDALGRKISEGSVFATKTMAYDLAGRRTRLSWGDASGFYVTYDYDNDDEMTAIHEKGATAKLVAFGYDNLGERTSKTYSNGASTTYGYDPISRLTSLSLNASTNANTITLGNYSPAGEIGNRSQTNDSYAYSATTNGTQAYAVNGLNQYTSVAGTSQAQDARGNQTFHVVWTIAYNSKNQAVSSASSSFGSAVFYYDPIGRMDTYSIPALHLDYDGGQMITELNNSDNSVARRYVFGPNVNEPLVWYEGAGTSDKRFLDADERGSIVRGTDASGAAKFVNAYNEYGDVTFGVQGSYLYAGQYFIGGLSAYYARNRVYSPSLGRFLQTDPIGYGDGPNWYNYVGSEPINRVDPSGLAYEEHGPHDYALVPVNGVPQAFGYDDAEGPPITVTGHYNPYQLLDELSSLQQASDALRALLSNKLSESTANTDTTQNKNCPPPPSRAPHGVAVFGAANVSGGVGKSGGVLDGSVGGGIFGRNFGGFGSYVASIFGGSHNASVPTQGGGGPAAVGAYAGFGGGVLITNATDVSQLEGPFTSYIVNTPVGSVNFSESNGIYTASLALGPGLFASGAKITTTTKTARGCK